MYDLCSMNLCEQCMYTYIYIYRINRGFHQQETEIYFIYRWYRIGILLIMQINIYIYTHIYIARAGYVYTYMVGIIIMCKSRYKGNLQTPFQGTYVYIHTTRIIIYIYIYILVGKHVTIIDHVYINTNAAHVKWS